MLSTSQVAVKAKWDSYAYPVLPGTPLGANGAVANTSSAVGIVMERIDKKPDNPDEELSIMAGGIADKAELEYDLSADAVQALNGIMIRGYERAGSGGSGVFYVDAEVSNGSITSPSKTFAETVAAYSAGQSVMLRVSLGLGNAMMCILQLSAYMETESASAIVFLGIVETTLTQVAYMNDGTFMVTPYPSGT